MPKICDPKIDISSHLRQLVSNNCFADRLRKYISEKQGLESHFEVFNMLVSKLDQMLRLKTQVI